MEFKLWSIRLFSDISSIYFTVVLSVSEFSQDFIEVSWNGNKLKRVELSLKRSLCVFESEC